MLEQKIIDFIDKIPVLELPLLDGVFSVIEWIIGLVAYFIPLDWLLTIFMLDIAIVNYKLIVKAAKTVWNALPFT